MAEAGAVKRSLEGGLVRPQGVVVWGGGSLFVLVAAFVALGIGSTPVGWRELTLMLVGGALGLETGAVERTDQVILLQLRLPRVLLAALVGAGLAMAGTAFQGLFRNPLAGPYVLGVSSGAALGAVMAFILGFQFSFLGLGAVPPMAFIGALVAITIVYLLAQRHGELDVTTMLLAGIAVAAMFSAMVSLLLTHGDQTQIQGAVFWLMGGLSGASWRRIVMTLPYVVVGAVILWALAQPLNAFLLGEEQAHHLGVETRLLKRVILVVASLVTAACVAASGAIAFVGLVVPHLVRLLVGPDHRLVLPGAFFFGAGFLILADAVARTVFAPAELQVGIITALIGGPFFLYILRAYRRRGAM